MLANLTTLFQYIFNALNSCTKLNVFYYLFIHFRYLPGQMAQEEEDWWAYAHHAQEEEVRARKTRSQHQGMYAPFSSSECNFISIVPQLGSYRVHKVRIRGGGYKMRALRLETGNYSWGSEAQTRKTRLLDVVYNASNNELVRTKTLVKNCIVQIDATPFRQWYEAHYAVPLGRRKGMKLVS